MKKLRFYFVATILLLLIGCCSKRGCEDLSQSTLALHNFSVNDVDSIAVEIFETVLQGKIRIDSSFTHASSMQNINSDFTINLSKTLRQNYSYKITFCSKNLGQVYIISDFILGTEQCDNCVIKSQNTDFTVLRSYTINGQIQYHGYLQIIK